VSRPVPAKHLHAPARLSPVPASLLLLLALSLSLAGCHSAATLASAQSLSPDGYWLATSSTIQFGGPTATLQTVVRLQHASHRPNPVDSLWSGEPWRPTTILRFTAPPAANPSAPPVEMTWLTPTHLQLSYPTTAHIDLQLSACSGVQISQTPSH
jgi:hypothetical protein